jgi:ribonuclease M5
MIRVERIIVVEGKYDKIKLSGIIDGVIIETEGFGIFKDKEKQKLLRKLAELKGLVILTDSDSAGFVIRSFISSIVPNEYIINAYIPDISGKEKRKDSPSKEGKLGVEGVDPDIILEALTRAGVFCSQSEERKLRAVTKGDLYDDGFTGTEDSKNKRLKLLKYLGLPERMTTNSMLKIINSYMTFDDYKEAVHKCSEVVL